MIADLDCITDAGVFVVCDPEAVLHLINQDYDRLCGTIDDEVTAGHLVACSYGGDGDMLFRLVVDEPVEERLVQRAQAKMVVVLRVPTGRLLAAGMEYLRAKDPVTAEAFEPEHGSVTTVLPDTYEGSRPRRRRADGPTTPVRSREHD